MVCGGAMAGGSGVRRYIVLGRHSMIYGHGKTEELTLICPGGSAASGKASRGRFVVGGWREKGRAR